MSVEAITWALKLQLPAGHASTKFVLVVLANCASGDTMTAHPSCAYICEATGQDRKTVLECLKRLREWGLIDDTGERKGQTKQVIVYRLRGADLLETSPKLGQSRNRNSSNNGTVPKSAGNSPNIPRKQSQYSREESQYRDTEPSEPSGTVKNPLRGCARDQQLATLTTFDRQVIDPYLSNLPDSIELQVFADFVKHRQAARRHLSISAWTQVLAELKSLAALGVDLNASLKETMAAGLAIPVVPRGPNGSRASPRPRANDDFSTVRYEGTPTDELPPELRPVPVDAEADGEA